MFNEILEHAIFLIKNFAGPFIKGFADGMIYGCNVNALGGCEYITKY